MFSRVILIFLFAVLIPIQSSAIDVALYSIQNGQALEISEITPASIVASSLCYVGNHTSHPVELARQIRDYNFNFQDLKVISTWALVRRGGEIEVTWTSTLGGSFNAFSGTSFIRNCEDLRF